MKDGSLQIGFYITLTALTSPCVFHRDSAEESNLQHQKERALVSRIIQCIQDICCKINKVIWKYALSYCLELWQNTNIWGVRLKNYLESVTVISDMASADSLF